MMHSFPRTFSLAERKTAPASAMFAGPLRPWDYLKLRREAARMSISAVAVMMTRDKRDVSPATDLIRMLERPGTTARHSETIERLRTAFPFDPAVYQQLRDEPADRHPQVCRCCGASEWDPGEGTLEWASPHACTRCVGDAAVDAERAE